jgi:hypothetical protein
MPRRMDKERGEDEEYFNETADDPYAIPTEDKYETPNPNNKNAYDTDTQFSKFVEDKWTSGERDTPQEGNSFDQIDELEMEKNKSAAEQQIQSKNDLTLELGTAGICGLLFVRNFVEGGVIGMAFGGIKGVIAGFQTGSNKAPGFARAVYAEAAINGRSLGLWLGTYRASKVLFARTRGVQDHLNTFAAGFCAGSMYMLHTRSPVQIMASGLSSGAMLSVLAAFGGSSL